MRFYTLEEREPKVGEVVLIKNSAHPAYYICDVIYDRREGEFLFVEACGECYTAWKQDEIIGYALESDIAKAEEWSQLDKADQYKGGTHDSDSWGA